MNCCPTGSGFISYSGAASKQEDEISVLSLPVLIEKNKIALVGALKGCTNVCSVKVGDKLYAERTLVFIGLFSKLDPRTGKYIGNLKFQEISTGTPISNATDFNILLSLVELE